MTSFRSLFGIFVVGLAALMALSFFLFELPVWFAAAALALIAGLIAGLLLGRRMGRAAHNASRPGQESSSAGPALTEFSSQLLDATLNEMREGLLVIDHEMRVVASNQTARDA